MKEIIVEIKQKYSPVERMVILGTVVFFAYAGFKAVLVWLVTL